MPSYDQSNIEGRICLAINAIKTNQISSIYAAARAYEVPKDIL